MNSPIASSKSSLGLWANVELLVGRLQRIDNAAVLDHEVDRQEEFDSLRAPLGDHAAGLLEPRFGNVNRLVLLGRIFGDAEASVFAVELRGGLPEAPESEPAAITRVILPRSIIASMSSSLSAFRPLNTTSCASRHRISGCVNSADTYLPSAT